MASYTVVNYVKPILGIELEHLTYDLELEECIARADAIIDSELLKHNLFMPDTAPQNTVHASHQHGLIKKPCGFRVPPHFVNVKITAFLKLCRLF